MTSYHTATATSKRTAIKSTLSTGFFTIILLAATTSCETTTITQSILDSLATSDELSAGTIIAGLREALQVGTANAVDKASSAGGFSANSRVAIKTPESMEKLAGGLRTLGFGSVVDQFEEKMNAAAEDAAAKAAPIFGTAVQTMSFDDARSILSGGDTAATDYFRERTSGPLRDAFMPVVTKSLDEVGAIAAYRNLADKYAAIPYLSKPSLSIEDYVADKTLDGLFTMLADEERKIREDPAARTSELLQRVFSTAK